MRKIGKPELLAPAGDLEKGRLALLYGADALYLGGKAFGLRAYAGNFTIEEIAAVTELAHSSGKKVYVTVNIFARDEDIAALPAYLLQLAACQVDGLLVSDLGVWATARQVVPQLPLHVSTQANTANGAAVRAWQQLGAARVVLARELSLQEIAAIAAETEVELETFVHGAMCIAYSGRCLLSSYLTGRDGNRGACTQACRWRYALVEEKRPGQFFSLEEDEGGSYIMNSKDLCLIAYLPDLLRLGLSSLKIEGRMKSAHYVATVVSVYRQAIDAAWADLEGYAPKPEWLAELDKVSHRAYTAGFALGRPDSAAMVYDSPRAAEAYSFVGLVLDYDQEAQRLYIQQRNNVKAGQLLEVLQPDGQVFPLLLKDMEDEEGLSIDCAPHAQQRFSTACPRPVAKDSILRRKNS